LTTMTTEKIELSRVLQEGYGPGAWHGSDLKAAVADVSPELAFWRPSPERHNIAEIALHHAYTARNVRGKLTGATPEPFVLEGDDWFPVSGPTPLDWPKIQAVLETEQRRLGEAVAAETSPLSEPERFDLVLGITCHAIYHAGQIQLLKVLRGA
jgi:hypothetical protein